MANIQELRIIQASRPSRVIMLQLDKMNDLRTILERDFELKMYRRRFRPVATRSTVIALVRLPDFAGLEWWDFVVIGYFLMSCLRNSCPFSACRDVICVDTGAGEFFKQLPSCSRELDLFLVEEDRRMRAGPYREDPWPSRAIGKQSDLAPSLSHASRPIDVISCCFVR